MGKYFPHEYVTSNSHPNPLLRKAGRTSQVMLKETINHLLVSLRVGFADILGGLVSIADKIAQGIGNHCAGLLVKFRLLHIVGVSTDDGIHALFLHQLHDAAVQWSHPAAPAPHPAAPW